MSRRGLIGLALALGCMQKQAAAPAPAPVAVATPPVSKVPPLLDAAGLSALLASHKGRPVLVNVFASWCGPCRKELPGLEKLAASRPQLFLLGIDVDEKVEDVVRFLPQVPSAFTVRRRPGGIETLLPAFHLPDDWMQAVPPGWDKTVPLTFVYDAGGEFQTGSVGELSREAFAAITEVADESGNGRGTQDHK
jgi:thiol-disulfide isomerase/thioredoxin